MISELRGKLGAWIVGGIISFIAFVFIFQGVFSPKATRGLHEGAVAGKVNGESIPVSEFNRALNRRMESIKQMTGGKITEEQIKMFRLREGTFQELVQQKLIAQEAHRSGLEASDEQVRKSIMEMNVFQKDGHFDQSAYLRTLEANNYTANQFEKMMRDQLSIEEWIKSISSHVKVSDAELKDEYLTANDQRNLKYVVLSPESPKLDSEAAKAIAGKPGAPADEKAQQALAQESLKKDQAAKSELAEKIARLMKADKNSDKAVNDLLKPYKAEVRYSAMMPKSSMFIPGLGDEKSLMTDAFQTPSPIDPAQGGKAKVYNSAGRYVVALVSEAKHPNLAKFDSDKPSVAESVKVRKERALMDSVMKGLTDKAKIDSNPSVVGESNAG